MDIWKRMYEKAKEQYHPEEVSPFIYAHNVVCAIEAENGDIYTGFCIESCSGVMNICADRLAALNMYANSGQTKIKRFIAFRDSAPNGGGSGMPCGACQEFFYQLNEANVILYISKIGLKQGYTLVTAYVINKRKNPESDIAGMMFQVNLRAYSQDKMDIFVAEHICRKILAVDEFYFAQRPILGRGRGCAATWKANKNGRASEIVSTFIPEYEFPGVSAALEGFDPFFFSMRTLSVAKKKDDIINRLNVLADSYENWIQKKLVHDSKMDDAKFKKEIGNTIINKCIEAL